MASSAASIAVQLQKLTNEATEKSFKYNKEEAASARKWQTEMSNTAHVREVADLKKAGLNPVLSANSGAQSYTTSAASAQAENAANAVGNVWSAQMSADATRAAAAQNAAAMKQAAATAASAQRYAAAMAFESQKYHSDKAYEATKYKADKDYKIAMDKPASNLAGIIDKWSQKSGLSNSLLNTIKKNANAFIKDPKKYFSNLSNVNQNNFKLNTVGKTLVNARLKSMGLTTNSHNQKLFVKSFVFGDKASNAALQSAVIMNRTNKKINKAVNPSFPAKVVKGAKRTASTAKSLLR